MAASFYTISDARFFVGTVALLNSLRVTGHEQDLVILDGGFTPEQRRLLAPHSTFVEVASPPEDRRLLKPFPALVDPEGIVVLVDSDMVITDSLAPILAHAASGRICVFPDHPSDACRWFEEWRDVFALRAPLRHQPYVNSGFLAVPTQHWPELLTRWWETCEQIGARRELVGDPRWEPTDQADQDALNALLMSEVPAGAVEQLLGYEWDLRRVVVEDVKSLVCVSDGRRQPLLHTPLNPKVWQPDGWRRVGMNTAYVRLLPRLLFGPDVAVRLEPEDVPLWVRPGRRPRLVARSATACTQVPTVLRRARRAPRRVVRHAREALAAARRRASGRAA